MSKDAAAEFINQLASSSDAREALMDRIRDAAAEATMQEGADAGHKFSGHDLVEAYVDYLKGQGLENEDIEDLAKGGPGPHFAYASTSPKSMSAAAQPYSNSDDAQPYSGAGYAAAQDAGAQPYSGSGYGGATHYGGSRWYSDPK